jgi:hypothetical protein
MDDSSSIELPELRDGERESIAVDIKCIPISFLLECGMSESWYSSFGRES